MMNVKSSISNPCIHKAECFGMRYEYSTDHIPNNSKSSGICAQSLTMWATSCGRGSVLIGTCSFRMYSLIAMAAGDAQISIGQLLRLAGALIVTTPQDLALIDARRGATLFRTMKVQQGFASVTTFQYTVEYTRQSWGWVHTISRVDTKSECASSSADLVACQVV